MGLAPHTAASMPLEILDFEFVLLCLPNRREGSQVAALPGIFLARIQAELLIEFSDHGEVRQRIRRWFSVRVFQEETRTGSDLDRSIAIRNRATLN